MEQTVIILDYGNRGSQSLAKRVRAHSVYSQILPFTTPIEEIVELQPIGIIHSIHSNDTPLLEIDGIPTLTAETTLSDQALSDFLFTECKASSLWTTESFIEREVKSIQERVKDKKVLLGLSGGVDSSTVALLLHKAIGNQLIPLFINNGLLRKGEPESVKTLFASLNLRYVDATELFLTSLEGVTDPEQKRKIIGTLFIEVFEREARSLGEVEFLAQGTLYADVIESVQLSGGGVAVKSHHNVGGLPEDLKFTLIEPLRELFKDEVREVGRALGLPDNLVDRHPFPGPGLGVRCVGAITPHRLETLREIDAIFIEEIRKANLYHSIWQALATLLPVKSVGVRNNKRVYEEVCTLRAVLSEDAMSATWYKFSPQLLEKISDRILTEVEHVSRVLYDITKKPPGTIEWE